MTYAQAVSQPTRIGFSLATILIVGGIVIAALILSRHSVQFNTGMAAPQSMGRLFSIYGAAIGPTIAFILGVVAFLIRDAMDARNKKQQMRRRLKLLRRIIQESPPPSKFFPRVADSGLLHADQARNLTNIARFYGRLLTTQALLAVMKDEVFQFGNIGEINQYSQIKWWHEILVQDIEELRAGRNVDHQSFMDITSIYSYLTEAASSNPHDSLEGIDAYIE